MENSLHPLSLTLLITASCAKASRMVNHTPMSRHLSPTGLRVSQTNLCASKRISIQLLRRANKGARGKAATKMVIKPNWRTVEKKNKWLNIITKKSTSTQIIKNAKGTHEQIRWLSRTGGLWGKDPAITAMERSHIDDEAKLKDYKKRKKWLLMKKRKIGTANRVMKLKRI